ncbi:phosphoribosyltransferase domain-containing protein [Sphingobium sp. MK2]|uniref:phosphoribosyltransferase n=1 Tax=Sphingobium sp. MK2 TaxID=3116540 RepID=UPI0032E35B0E
MHESAKPHLHYITNDAFLADVQSLAQLIDQSDWKPDFIIGIGRGGLVPAVYISHQTQLPMLSIDHSSKVPGFADELLAKVAAKSATGQRLLFIDDINDSGGTIDYVRRLLADNGCQDDNLRFAVIVTNSRSRVTVDYWAQMIDRDEDKRWFVFPWEAVGTKDAIVEEALSVPERLS